MGASAYHGAARRPFCLAASSAVWQNEKPWHRFAFMTRRFWIALAVALAPAACQGTPRGAPARSAVDARLGRDANGTTDGTTAEDESEGVPEDERTAEHHASSEDGAEADEETEGPDDDFDEEPPPDATAAPPHPFAGMSDAELERKLTESPASLGSMSIGKPNAGMLFNGVVMPPGDSWTVVSSAQTWGTEETIRYLTTVIEAVRLAIPNTPRVAIGDISARGGGYIKPHLSHQAGRDVDLGYYYLDGEHWYARATAQTLDARRTWALVRAIVTLSDVEMILIDHSVQALLREEAEREGEDPDWVQTLFRGKGSVPPMIRHAPGHATHLHVRFYNPTAQETGRRCYAALVRQHKVVVGPAFLTYVAKKGDTLLAIAKRHGTTVRAIKHANSMKTTKIQAKRSYRIPQTGRAPPALSSRPVAIPPRRLPPAVARQSRRDVLGSTALGGESSRTAGAG
jgi:penicillin-insensitive murein endopeptidase